MCLFSVGEFDLGLGRDAACGASIQKSSPVASERRDPVASVNGTLLSEADLDRLFQIQQIPREDRERLRDSMLDRLIERTLVRQFLAKSKIAVPKGLIDDELVRLESFEGAKGGELARKGYPPNVLREEVEFRLVWRQYVVRYDDGRGLRDYFQKHRAEFDGTQVHARQILRKVASDDLPARQAAVDFLRGLRRQIDAGETPFEEAAQEHSDAPSRDQGGDLGWFPFRGKMPEEVARAAFACREGEQTEPFASPFGVHLLQVIERRPGELSLEDVRDEVLAAYGDQLWKTTVERLKKSARIERGGVPQKAGGKAR